MIIFDMDGTLSLVAERIKFLKQTPKDWDAFYDACDQDTVNQPIQSVFQSLRADGHQ